MRYGLLTILAVSIISGCYKDIEPIPNSTQLSPSLSFPVGQTEFSVAGGYTTIGLPEINLTDSVPDWAHYHALEFTDRVALDLSKVYQEASSITYLAFRINVWNQLPAAGSFQAYFYDSANQLLDSLSHDGPLSIPLGRINASGEVLSEGYLKADIPLSSDRITLLGNATLLVVHSVINLDNVQPNDFQWFDSLKVKCQLGVRVDFNFETTASISGGGS